MADPMFATGNAADDTGHRGWIVGHFMPAGPALSYDAEVKWGIHPAGDQRPVWTEGDTRSSLCLLISGEFRLDFTDGDNDWDVLLTQPGDYACWGPGVDHSWQAETDAAVVTVRWPSLR